jgi:mRNA interferase HigB
MLQDVRATTFPDADAVRVASGRTVVLFNIAGSKLRLIAAIHYNRRLVFALTALTHAQYRQGRWKESL